MQCGEFEREMQRVLDERGLPAEDPQLAEHAQGCERCAVLLRGQERLFQGLAMATGSPQLAAIPTEAVLAIPVAEVPHAGSVRRRWLALAVTAAVLFTCALWGWRPAADSDSPAMDSRAMSASPGIAAMGVIEVPRASAADYGWLEDLFEQIAVGAELESVDQIAGGLRPLATTLNVAFDTLLRSFPGSEVLPPADRWHAA